MHTLPASNTWLTIEKGNRYYDKLWICKDYSLDMLSCNAGKKGLLLLHCIVKLILF